jgi:hypothetical protein
MEFRTEWIEFKDDGRIVLPRINEAESDPIAFYDDFTILQDVTSVGIYTLNKPDLKKWLVHIVNSRLPSIIAMVTFTKNTWATSTHEHVHIDAYLNDNFKFQVGFHLSDQEAIHRQRLFNDLRGKPQIITSKNLPVEVF